MKPLVYGYMRVSDETPDDEVRSTERQLKKFAEVEGYCFGAIFYEYEPGSYAAFNELIEALQRSEAHAVVVSELSQLADSPRIQALMITEVECRANAAVHEIPHI